MLIISQCLLKKIMNIWNIWNPIYIHPYFIHIQRFEIFYTAAKGTLEKKYIFCFLQSLWYLCLHYCQKFFL